MKIKIFVSFILSGIVLTLFFYGLNNNNQYNTEYLVGKKINSFELKSFSGKNKISSEELVKNNYTLINFWASWCSPCRKEHAFLMSLSNNPRLKIFGVNFKDKPNNAINFINELGNPYNYLAQDSDGRESVKFGIYGIPESILVDKNLQVIKKFVGPISHLDYKEIIKIIKVK